MNKPWQEKSVRLQRYLKSIRKKSGLTQKVLAATLNKPQSYISKYERGERKLDLFEALEILEACGRYDVNELIDELKPAVSKELPRSIESFKLLAPAKDKIKTIVSTKNKVDKQIVTKKSPVKKNQK